MGEEFPAELVASLESKAREVRAEIIRMTFSAGSGHPGSSLSVVDLLVSLLFHEMRIDPARPDALERDRLVLSKGHAAPALYAALALRGFFPREELRTLRQIGSRLQGLVDRTTLPGVDASAGGLGQGLGVAVGMALDGRLAQRPSRVYVIVGDGECQVGSTWEALLAGAQFHLANLTVLVDRNGLGTASPTEKNMGIEPITDKLRAFRYRTLEIDGHDVRQILGALAEARTASDAPTAIVAHTVKGKGVSFMEGNSAWHGRAPNRAEAEGALAELGASLEAPLG